MELTPIQAAFVQEYVRSGGKGAEAFRAVNPDAQRPDARAWELLRVPHVAEAIQDEGRKRLKGLSGEAIEVLVVLMRDPKQPGKVRQSCADSILDRAGITAKAAELRDAEGRQKAISEMSAGELADLAQKQRAALLALEAKMVDVTPVSAQPPIQVIDNIEEA